MPQQLCSHPLPQLSKELHGVISALGKAQGLCPEWETPRRRCHNTTHKETQQELSCARQVPAQPCTNPSSSPEPVAAVGQHSQGCLTPCQAQQKQPSLTARSSAPSCWDKLPAHPPATLEAQTGAEAPPAQGGLGV